ncbi:hypothetical protein [Candidatus Lokiarchaeum ossiferum]|uniref:hypothetical protein n=1 Tax=Candidatus Lokiarchaeum ossiferum TaxID=2951803 RepID=UPI00352E32CA
MTANDSTINSREKSVHLTLDADLIDYIKSEGFVIKRIVEQIVRDHFSEYSQKVIA